MRSMKLIFFSITVICLFVLTCGWMNRVSLVSSYMSSYLKVPVKIDSIERKGLSLNFKKLHILNPSGSHSETALAVAHLSLSVNSIFDVFSSDIVIQHVFMEDVVINLEFFSEEGGQSNWAFMLGDFMEEDEQPSSSKSFEIALLEAKDIYMELRHPILGTSKESISFLQLEHVGDGKQFNGKNLTRLIGKILLRRFMRVPQFDKVIKNAIKLPARIIDHVISPFKSPSKL